MGYPLVPGYEAVGRVVRQARPARSSRRRHRLRAGLDRLQGRARPVRRRRLASRRARRPRRRRSSPGSARAACCWRSPPPPTTRSMRPCRTFPELIVGHGSLGRLLARIVVAMGGPPPTVWEREPIPPRRRRGLRGGRFRVGSAPRLSFDHRRQRRSGRARRRSSRGSRPAARSASPASTPSRCRLPSHRPSCARRACASRRNGSARTSTWSAAWRFRARCRSKASSPTGPRRPTPPKLTRPPSAIPPASRWSSTGEMRA